VPCLNCCRIWFSSGALSNTQKNWFILQEMSLQTFGFDSYIHTLFKLTVRSITALTPNSSKVPKSLTPAGAPLWQMLELDSQCWAVNCYTWIFIVLTHETLWQALLKRTVEDYKRAGFDPSTSSLEIRLIQSQDDIRNPAVTCKAVRFGSWTHSAH
jgi:hypothetical protein